MTEPLFERYRALVPAEEWTDFLDATARPEPRTFRIRRGRVEPATLVDALAAQGFRISPISGLAGVFRADHEPFPLSETLEHWLGLLYIQQAATCLAAPALAPRPGDRVLDLCAAPGGKTSHLADEMEDTGCLVAVDLSGKRAQALAGNLSRLAHPSVITVVGDALRIPETSSFDRVLADVPCSGEGRSARDGPREASGGDLRRLPALQEALLRKALRLVRPGGRVLYVTCTLAPEENEGVVDAVLNSSGEGPGGSPPVRLLPLRPAVPHAPGLTVFESRRFAAALEGACRIHPHHLGSGVLFLACLERLGGEADPAAGTARTVTNMASAPGWTLPGARIPGERTPSGDVPEIPDLLDGIAAGTGLGREVLDRVSWLHRAQALRFHRMAAWPLDAWVAEGAALRVFSAGLRGVEQASGKQVRPSGDLLRWFAPELARRGVELDAAAWIRLLGGASVSSAGNEDRVLLHRGQPVALGRARGGRLLHDLPAGRAAWLRQVMQRLRDATPPATGG